MTKNRLPPPRFPFPCAVVSFLMPGGFPGLIGVSWFGLVSMQPPRLTLALQLPAPSLKMSGERFAVNLLSRRENLGMSPLTGDKPHFHWRPEVKNVPFLEGCPVQMVCELVEQKICYGLRLLIGGVVHLWIDDHFQLPDSPVFLFQQVSR